MHPIFELSRSHSTFSDICHPFSFDEYPQILEIFQKNLEENGATQTTAAIFEGKIVSPSDDKEKECKLLMTQLFAKQVMHRENGKHALFLELLERFPEKLTPTSLMRISFNPIRRLTISDLHNIFKNPSRDLGLYLEIPAGFREFVYINYLSHLTFRVEKPSIEILDRYMEYVVNCCPEYIGYFVNALFLQDVFIDYLTVHHKKILELAEEDLLVGSVIFKHLNNDPTLKMELLHIRSNDLFAQLVPNAQAELIELCKTLPFFTFDKLNPICIENALNISSFGEILEILLIEDQKNVSCYEAFQDIGKVLSPKVRLAIELLEGIYENNPILIEKIFSQIQLSPDRLEMTFALAKNRQLICDLRLITGHECCSFFDSFLDTYKSFLSQKQIDTILISLSPDKIYSLAKNKPQYVQHSHYLGLKNFLKNRARPTISRNLTDKEPDSVSVHERMDYSDDFFLENVLVCLLDKEADIKKRIVEIFGDMSLQHSILTGPFLEKEEVESVLKLVILQECIDFIPLLRKDVLEQILDIEDSKFFKWFESYFIQTILKFQTKDFKRSSSEYLTHAKNTVHQVQSHLLHLKKRVGQTKIDETKKRNFTGKLDLLFEKLVSIKLEIDSARL
jgi:hypothetical protein